MKSDGGGFCSNATEFPGAVQVMHVRKFLVTEFVVLVGEKSRCVTNCNVALPDTGVVNELPEKSDHHLRRRVHVIQFIH